jgi:hypothetical protein
MKAEDVGSPPLRAALPLQVEFSSAAIAKDDPIELRAGRKNMGCSSSR